MADHSERSKSIFGSLELSKDSPLQQKETGSHSPSKRHSCHSTSEPRERGHVNRDHQRESNRKRYRHGDGTNFGSRKTPDYVVHPDKWTRYDLDEDKASKETGNMTDQQRNTFAAMSFLGELKARKATSDSGRLFAGGEMEAVSRDDGPVFKTPSAPVDGRKRSSLQGEQSCSQREDFGGEGEGKPVFRRPALSVDSSSSHGDSEEEERKGKVTSTWNHARVMPEYVVGAKVDRSRIGRSSGRNRQVVDAGNPASMSDGNSGSSKWLQRDGVKIAHILQEGEPFDTENMEASHCDELANSFGNSDSDSLAKSHDCRMSTEPQADDPEMHHSSHDDHMTSEQPLHVGHMTDLCSSTSDPPVSSCKPVVAFKTGGGKKKSRGFRSHRNVATD